MHTLLKESKEKRWYPRTVEEYRDNLILYRGTQNRYQILSNFAYNMQYIEYLKKQIEELKVSSVIESMLYKTFIITAMSIIEMLFASFLKAIKQWKTTNVSLISTTTSNFKKHNDKELKTIVEIYEKCSPYQVPIMDFDSMIKKIESKSLLTVNHKVYPILKQLKKLRNKVHLQECSDYVDHDYNNFSQKDYTVMKKILYVIISCDEFCRDKHLYKFLLD